jgi:hypothetical protein
MTRLIVGSMFPLLMRPGLQWCHRAVLASWHAVAKENADLYFYLKFDEMDLMDREERDLHSVIA